MSRVHIGEKNGQMGAWVSSAGIDASAEGIRMLLDSDLDNLKPHYTGSVDLYAALENYMPEYGLWLHYPPPFTFPDLGFIPLTFLTCTPGSTSGGVAAWPPFAGSPAAITDVPTERSTATECPRRQLHASKPGHHIVAGCLRESDERALIVPGRVLIELDGSTSKDALQRWKR